MTFEIIVVGENVCAVYTTDATTWTMATEIAVRFAMDIGIYNGKIRSITRIDKDK